MKKQIWIPLESLEAARKKYLQLGREIEALPFSATNRGNLQHTHSKLGIFLEECFGKDWREADER